MLLPKRPVQLSMLGPIDSTGQSRIRNYRTMANFFEPPRYIAVEGPIRVGKSTLSRVIAERLHGQLIHEPEDNPFLGAFYDNEPGAAFQTQFSFLIQRFEQLHMLEAGPNSRKVIVA